MELEVKEMLFILGQLGDQPAPCSLHCYAIFLDDNFAAEVDQPLAARRERISVKRAAVRANKTPGIFYLLSWMSLPLFRSQIHLETCESNLYHSSPASSLMERM